MAAPTKVVSPPSPQDTASCLAQLIANYLEENNLNVYRAEEIEDLQRAIEESTNRELAAVKSISEKDSDLEKIKEENRKLQKQLKIQNQWLIQRWTETVINPDRRQDDKEGGFNIEDQIPDKRMTQLMKRLQTRVIENHTEKVKEIQALQEDKKILLQNQSKLLAVIRDIAEFSEYPEPDRFQDHEEERRMVSQSHLTNFVDHLKNLISAPPKPNSSLDQEGHQSMLPVPTPKVKPPTQPPVQAQQTSSKVKPPTPLPVQDQQTSPKSSSPRLPVSSANQPILPSPPKRTRRDIVSIEEVFSYPEPHSTAAHVTPELPEVRKLGEKAKAWFACEPCGLEFDFAEDLKDHFILHDNGDGRLLSYSYNDPKPSTSSSGKLPVGSGTGFRKLSGCSVGRRVVVIAEEEEEKEEEKEKEEEQEVESTEPAKNAFTIK